MRLFELGAIGISFLLLATSASVAKDFRCDKFDVRATLNDDVVTISLDSDCPKFAMIMVSVSRTYYEREGTTAYSHSYFDTKSTVGEFRSPKRISVGHSKWRKVLNAHRKKMGRLGLGYVVGRIDNHLEVRMVLPVNQKDNRLDRRNENLVGKAVEKKGLRVVSSRVRLPYPLGGSPVDKN